MIALELAVVVEVVLLVMDLKVPTKTQVLQVMMVLRI